jgi:DNA polymerase-3 subunit beta
MKIEIRTQQFAATTLFRSTADVRHYIEGVYLETGEYGGRLVATDGHQLAIAKIEGEFPSSSIILPASLATAIKYTAKTPQVLTLEYEVGSAQYFPAPVGREPACVVREIRLTCGDQTIVGRELEGKFPDFRRVVPDTVSGELAQYDPQLTNRILKAAKLLGYKHFPGIAYNGTAAAVSVIDPGFLVLTMALRAEQPTADFEWSKAALNPTAAIIPFQQAA